MTVSKDKRQEHIIYGALWALLFAAPVMSLYIHTNATQEAFDWSEVLTVWRQVGLFFLIFLVHNFLLAPLLVFRQRKAIYFGVVAVLVGCFTLYQCASHPHDKDMGPRPDMMADERGPRPPEFGTDDMPPEFGDDGMPPFADDGPRPLHQPGEHHPPLVVGGYDALSVIVLVLMLGMNIGVKLYFKQRHDEKQLALLERQNLEQQLEYLKYQINPHFLMNTLNNIHALVDIDPEKAKETIVELSKIMRFVLYEGSKQTVPLSREVAFLKNYITLMRLRYPERVSITTSIPDALPDREIPPLMLITFVENAFKHGISYQQDSFIDISLATNSTQQALTFRCRNSKIPQKEDHHGGVGLQNVKQRLTLIYGKNYTLNIDDNPNDYNIELIIPL